MCWCLTFNAVIRSQGYSPLKGLTLLTEGADYLLGLCSCSHTPKRQPETREGCLGEQGGGWGPSPRGFSDHTLKWKKPLTFLFVLDHFGAKKLGYIDWMKVLEGVQGSGTLRGRTMS